MRPPSWLRRRGDAVLAVLVAAEMLRELAAAGTLAERPVSVLLGLLATLPLAYRRRAPLTSFVVLWSAILVGRTLVPVLSDEGLVFIAVFFVSLYSLGAHARGAAAWAGAVLVVAGVVTFVLNDGDAFAPGDVVFGTALVAGPWGTGLTIRLRRETERDLVSHAQRLEQEQEESARQAVAQERARIARELHDVVSHAISVTVLQARGGRRMLELDPGAAREAFDAIEHANTQALGDMRRLLAVLRETDAEPDPSPQPSLAGLDRLVEQLRRSGLEVELQVEGDLCAVPPGIDLSAYRIVQEALTNVLKHAGGRRRVQVGVRCHSDELEVQVEDDGTGPAAPTSPGGHGLLGMRERVTVAGGDLEAGPRPQGGFRVRARLPYQVHA